MTGKEEEEDGKGVSADREIYRARGRPGGRLFMKKSMQRSRESIFSRGDGPQEEKEEGAKKKRERVNENERERERGGGGKVEKRV